MERSDRWLLGRLLDLVGERPDFALYTELANGDDETGQLTALGLARRAAGVAARLGELPSKPGDRAIVFDVNGLDTLAATFGCFAAGVSPIVLPAPRRPEHVEARLLPVALDSESVALLVPTPQSDADQAVLDRLAGTGSHEVVALDDIEEADPSALPDEPLHPRAFVQYTSGSTAAPRGVMIEHRHLTTNLEMARERFEWRPDSVIVSWNPLSHDMGLILGAFPAVHVGFPMVTMPPAAFILRPSRWLAAITRYGATNSHAPNFAYDLCVDRIKEEDRDAFDLSTWRVALNGAEPVREPTRERFLEAYGPRGFRPNAWCPAYGLAEATVLVSCNGPALSPQNVWIDRGELGEGRTAFVDPGGPDASQVVGCGTPVTGLEVVVADPDQRTRMPEGGVGELWVRGPSVTAGYFRTPPTDDDPFEAELADGGGGGFLRTGDIGFIHEGELYIVGRAKDVLIVHGRNVHAVDVELAARDTHPAIRPGGIAAFAVPTDEGERAVVAVEVNGDPSHAEVARAVRDSVFRALELPVHDVVLVAPQGVPKTTSGKVQRRETRRQYTENLLPAPKKSEPVSG